MMGHWMMGWFWIWPVLVLVGLALLGYVAYRLTQNRGSGSPAGPSSARHPFLRIDPGTSFDYLYAIATRRRTAELPGAGRARWLF